jgi:hypothetical protein
LFYRRIALFFCVAKKQKQDKTKAWRATLAFCFILLRKPKAFYRLWLACPASLGRQA